jgi:hypothetical protein
METSIENGATQSFLKIAQIVHEMDISFYSVLLLQSGANRCAISFCIGDFYFLVVSLVFVLSVTRCLPSEELAVLAVFNTGFSTASAMLSYASVRLMRDY